MDEKVLADQAGETLSTFPLVRHQCLARISPSLQTSITKGGIQKRGWPRKGPSPFFKKVYADRSRLMAAWNFVTSP
jgi:hypothetical protein